MQQVALITGAATGIGRAIALRLASEGIAVVVADRDAQGGQAVVHHIRTSSALAEFIQTDVTSEQDVHQMIRFTIETFGALTILVNNAGGAPAPNFPAAPPAHWTSTLDLNLRSVMLSIQAALPVMEQDNGLIVNIASIAGVGNRWHDAPEYAATKAAVMRLTTALVPIPDHEHIRINCICPGWVATEAVRQTLATTSAAELATRAIPPPKRLIQPEEIADLVMLFVRDESLNGRVIIWPDDEDWRFATNEHIP